MLTWHPSRVWELGATNREPRVSAANATPVESIETGVPELVVIVDDEPAILGIITEHLRERKLKVFATSVAREAYLYLLDHRTERCLLITDVVLKGESGWDLAQALRKHIPGLPVLLVSGCIEERTLSSGIVPQNMSFLQKPFTLQSLDTSVNTLSSL